MFRSHAKIACVFGLGVLAGFLLSSSAPTFVVGSADVPAAAGDAGDTGSKPATAATKKANAAFAKGLPFADKQAFADAQKGFIAPLPDNGVIKNKAGAPVWDHGPFGFIKLGAKCPDTVNPSLWRQAQLLTLSGLFKVTDGIYQVRGADLSDIIFVEGKGGITIIDPLISAETARASLDLYYQHRPKKPIVAVIYTHSHADHFGGVRGVVSEKDVADGKVKIFAP